MADVFISYARDTKEKVRRIAQAIERDGYDVWWDAELPPHRSYSEVITEEVARAKAVVVVWSKAASASEWVRAEADMARNQKKLIQTAVEDVIPPLPFNQIQVASLAEWSGDADDPEWLKVRASLADLVRGDGSSLAEQAAKAATRAPSPIRKGWPWIVAGVLGVAVATAALTGGWRDLFARSEPDFAGPPPESLLDPVAVGSANIFEMKKGALVRLEALTGDGQAPLCNGVLIDARTVLTTDYCLSADVLDGVSSIRAVIEENGREAFVAGDLASASVDPSLGYGAVRLERDVAAPSLQAGGAPAPGAPLVAVFALPGGAKTYMPCTADVSAPMVNGRLMSSCTPGEGAAGAGVFDGDGRFVAVHYAIMSQADGALVGLGVPVDMMIASGKLHLGGGAGAAEAARRGTALLRTPAGAACNGVLISQRHVLAPASCLANPLGDVVIWSHDVAALLPYALSNKPAFIDAGAGLGVIELAAAPPGARPAGLAANSEEGEALVSAGAISLDATRFVLSSPCTVSREDSVKLRRQNCMAQNDLLGAPLVDGSGRVLAITSANRLAIPVETMRRVATAAGVSVE